eukprot:scaffold8373_cov34-Phaeocystis_antarctica.AAC.1
MPFLAAPYQQDDLVSPQMSPVSSPGAWHGPRSYCGIAGARLAVFVDKAVRAQRAGRVAPRRGGAKRPRSGAGCRAAAHSAAAGG